MGARKRLWWGPIVPGSGAPATGPKPPGSPGALPGPPPLSLWGDRGERRLHRLRGVCGGLSHWRAGSGAGDDGLSLTFDAALCTACGQCLPRCPEARHQVLRLQRVTDLEHLSQGRTPVYQDTNVRCQNCGTPIASGTMLKRMEAMLGKENGPVLDVATRYCPNCRMAELRLPSPWNDKV